MPNPTPTYVKQLKNGHHEMTLHVQIIRTFFDIAIRKCRVGIMLPAANENNSAARAIAEDRKSYEPLYSE